jgi:hypothetical protein
MTHLEKWTKAGLIENSATNKETIAIALETTANYIRELRSPSNNYTDMDSIVIPGMAKLYHNIPAKEETKDDIIEKVKEMYSELEKTHPEIEALRGWSHIDFEAELLHYVVDRMIEKYSKD